MVSQIREFQALSAVGNFPLLQTILCTSIPERHSPGKNGKAGLKGLTTDLGDRLRFDYNESQVSAIAAAVGKLDLAAEAHQLALVQGPPGESDIFLESFVREDVISCILITMCSCEFFTRPSACLILCNVLLERDVVLGHSCVYMPFQFWFQVRKC